MRRLGHQAALGRRGVRAARARRLSRRQRLHRGQGSGQGTLRLPRSAVAGRRSRRPRRRLVRPRQRRPPAEPRLLGDLRRRHRGRRAAAVARLPADRRRAPDPRVRPAAEEGRGGARPTSPSKYGVDVLDRFAAPLASLPRDGYLARARPGSHRADAPGAAARRRAAAPLLPAPAHGDPLHLMSRPMPLPRCSTRPAVRRRPAAVRVPSPLHPLDLAYARAGLEPPAATPSRRTDPAAVSIAAGAPARHDADARGALRRPRRAAAAVDLHERPLVLPPRAAGAGVSGPAGRDGRDPHEARRRCRARSRPRSAATAVPLGRILRDGGVDFTSMPREFFAVTPNPEMMGVFWMREPRTLYGRRTEVLLDGRAHRRHRRSPAARLKRPREDHDCCRTDVP